MKTVDNSWIDCSNQLYNYINDTNVDPLYKAFLTADNAINTVVNAGDIGSLNISMKFDDIEVLNLKRRKLVSFCNAIHYEISQMVDNPFSTSIADLIESAYELNPSDYKVKSGTTFWWDNIQSLEELLKSTIIDIELKKDYDSKFKALDKDKISKDLKDAIKEAIFWDSEFKKSEQCEAIAAVVFTADIRANWITMTDQEKKSIIQEYVFKISHVLFEKSTSVKYDSDGFGYSNEGILWGVGRHISIAPEFINVSIKNYAVDKVIDTLTHETRHQYQSIVKRSAKKYKISKNLKNMWNAPYIDSDDKNYKYYDYYSQEVESDARAFAAISSPEE